MRHVTASGQTAGQIGPNGYVAATVDDIHNVKFVAGEAKIYGNPQIYNLNFAGHVHLYGEVNANSSTASMFIHSHSQYYLHLNGKVALPINNHERTIKEGRYSHETR